MADKINISHSVKETDEKITITFDINKNNDNSWVEEESWFEHSSEEHDIDDGYCMECDCELEDCEE